MGLARRLLRWGRVVALVGLALLLGLIALAWTGVIQEGLASRLIAPVVVLFFVGVAVHAGSFAFAITADGSEFETATSLRTWARVPDGTAVSYEETERTTYAAGLRLWAALISAFVLAVALGLLFGDAGGFVGLVLGGVLLLAALANLIWSFIRLIRVRADVWVQLGRKRWELGLYLAGCLVLGLVWFTARSWLHGVRLGLLDGATICAALIGLRSYWRELW